MDKCKRQVNLLQEEQIMLIESEKLKEVLNEDKRYIENQLANNPRLKYWNAQLEMLNNIEEYIEELEMYAEMEG